MIEKLEDLIQHYKNKTHYLSDMLKEKTSEQDIARVKAKRSTYMTVITDLENLIKLQDNN